MLYDHKHKIKYIKIHEKSVAQQDAGCQSVCLYITLKQHCIQVTELPCTSSVVLFHCLWLLHEIKE